MLLPIHYCITGTKELVGLEAWVDSLEFMAEINCNLGAGGRVVNCLNYVGNQLKVFACKHVCVSPVKQLVANYNVNMTALVPILISWTRACPFVTHMDDCVTITL